MIITKIPEPGSNSYFIQHKEYKAVIRALDGHDLEFAAYQDINSLSGINKVYSRLIIKEAGPLLDLDLEDYSQILLEVKRKIFKFLISPQNWLEIIYVLEGRKFSNNWRRWLDTPIEDLFAMLEVAKKLEKPIL